jgi:hypothetical protein
VGIICPRVGVYLGEATHEDVRLQVLTAMSMKMDVFLDVALRSSADIDRQLRGAYCLHHHSDELKNMPTL